MKLRFLKGYRSAGMSKAQLLQSMRKIVRAGNPLGGTSTLQIGRIRKSIVRIFTENIREKTSPQAMSR